MASPGIFLAIHFRCKVVKYVATRLWVSKGDTTNAYRMYSCTHESDVIERKLKSRKLVILMKCPNFNTLSQIAAKWRIFFLFNLGLYPFILSIVTNFPLDRKFWTRLLTFKYVLIVASHIVLVVSRICLLPMLFSL